MAEPNETIPVTVPAQPEAKPPLRKSTPVVVALVAILGLIGLSNLSSLLKGDKRSTAPGSVAVQPSAPNARQVTSFENQQMLEANRDAAERQRQQQLATAIAQLQQAEAAPAEESATAPVMTPAQRAAIYGESAGAPNRTSEHSELRAEAKQAQLDKEKHAQDAINSPTLAIDFEHASSGAPAAVAAPATPSLEAPQVTPAAEEVGRGTSARPPNSAAHGGNKSAIASYDFDTYEGRLYRVFEGTVLEGVVTNHIDGGLAGPILVSLTTDLYSHDHQQLLLPQGTRLLGSVQNVGNAQQRKMFVTFHRAICPDGFSLEFDRYLGLDQIGTTGLATKVDHGYLATFAAAAAIGGLGGLAQIGNNTSILDPSTEMRNGISEQSAVEAEQVLNHFLDRLPVITLKEGSRARIYIGADLLIPSYAEHRVDPAL